MHMTTTDTRAIDAGRLEAFVGQAVLDMGAAISGLLLHIGDRLGLYQAMAGAAPVTPAGLAGRPGLAIDARRSYDARVSAYLRR
jgi:hypothetical protein